MIASTIIDLTSTVLHQAAEGYFAESMKGLLNAIRFVFSIFTFRPLRKSSLP